MQESDWVIEPVPTQAEEIRAAVRSPRLLAVLLNRICWTEMCAVEALSIAVRYFSRFPRVALNCARHSADEARHTAMLAARTIELGGRLKPRPGRSDMLNMLPGFKTEGQGDLDILANFLTRGYVEEYRGLLVFQALIPALEGDLTTQRMVERIARDERSHVAMIRENLEWLMTEGHEETVPSGLVRYAASKSIVV